MTGTRRLIGLALWLVAMTSGCATGRPLSLSGSMLPEGREIPAGNVLPRVAIVDFDFAEGDNAVIGRDYDNVRAIVWKGSPGPAIADLVALGLADQGIPVVRVSMAGHVPGGVLVTLRGRVDDFRVNAKRIHSVKVESAANVAVTIFAEGENVPRGWTGGPFSSDVWAAEPFFVTPEGVREAVTSASSGVAGEAVRRLMTLRDAFAPPATAPR